MNKLVDSDLIDCKVNTALNKVYELSNHQNRDTDEQRWKDYLQSDAFLIVRTDTLFMDELLVNLMENQLEDWIIKDLCRAYEIKKLVENSELLGMHKLYFYLADIREELLNKGKKQESKATINSFTEVIVGAWLYIQILILVIILIFSPFSIIRWLCVSFIVSFYDTPLSILVFISNCTAFLYAFIKRKQSREMFITYIVLFFSYIIIFVIFAFTAPDF